MLFALFSTNDCHRIKGVSNISVVFQKKSLLQNIFQIKGENSVNALKSVTASYYPGITTFVGKTGSGKSTLAKVSVGMITPTKGNVVLSSKEAHLKAYIYMDQYFYESYDSNSDIHKLFSTSTNYLTCWYQNWINELVLSSGLSLSKPCRPIDLSSSTLRKFEILLALHRLRSIITDENKTPVIVMDEYLDKEMPSILNKVADYIRYLASISSKVPVQFLIVTHSHNVWREFNEHTIVMKNGQVFDQGPVDKVRLPSDLEMI